MLNKKALGATAAADKLYVEDVFSTYLWNGTNTVSTITNGIDLAGEGGLVWLKRRSSAENHGLFSSNFGNPTPTHYLITNSTGGQSGSSSIFNFLSDGFSVDGQYGVYGGTGNTYASWTFRKAEKFFDVVTYTGNDGTNRQISHNLGSAPGCVIVKRTDSTGAWAVWHRSFAGTNYNAYLNTTAAAAAETDFSSDGSGTMTSTSFCVNNAGTTNNSGATYVAYLFAHDAGGFGDSGSDSVIKCGSYTGNGSTTGPIIDLGWEPQWVIIKPSSATGQWQMYDTMRGWTDGGVDSVLYANLSAAEDNTNTNLIRPLATGFQLTADFTGNSNGVTYIYIAIRRGPMKTPETGTEVFKPTTTTATGVFSVGFPTDTVITNIVDATSANWNSAVGDRLRGANRIVTSSTAAEASDFGAFDFTLQNSFNNGIAEPDEMVFYNFRRAPGFFDVVCYTGTGSARTVSHNLGVVPELMIVKMRSSTQGWIVYAAPLGQQALELNTTGASFSTTYWNSTNPTSSVFSVGSAGTVNGSGSTYVWYGFASVAGVSKVGSYTGTGTTLQVNCGFTSGARFVLIKRTDSTGDWYVWDSARGIVSGNDPYLLLNSTLAEVTNTDYIDTYSSGFEISSTAPAAINANGGTFIFLAIA